MLINIAKYYINLLVEKEGYISIILFNEREYTDDVDIETRYDEMRYLKKKSTALRNEMIKYVKEVDKELDKVSRDFNKNFEEASKEELNSFLESLEEERRILKQEYNLDSNKEALSYINHYEDLITEVKENLGIKGNTLKK